ncbi:MAG: 1-acyl-sn-glycerol-3-phosphate acyltransferase [Alphaproteobacteria bacterium]|nr:1-acyl-sn-glycerol-3-phosphate acyltransferase [Alphaproteobacteria bacterium]
MSDDVSVELDPVRKRDLLVSAALWGAGVSWLVPMLGTMGVLNATVLPSHRTELLNRLYCKGQVALTGSKWRAVVDPAVDPATPYMFAQNHTNHFDHVALYNATPHFKQGLELESHFKIPVYGWFMKARGTIGVRPGKQGQTPEIMENMRAEIGRGHSILAFPEGHRTLDGRVGPFRKGVFFIARDLGLPIAPVAVTGMYRVMRKGSWLIRPGNTVTVYVDAPIETKGVPDSGIDDLADHVRSVIAGRVDAYWRGEIE